MHCPTLEQSTQAFYECDEKEWPRITVVTPSYNQGQFIEQTIQSVLLQGYPNLEYIIIDGGSTDNTIEIIRTYERHLAHWESGTDRGQADAINKGFHRATGEVLAWLNSDDMYLPTALSQVSNYFKQSQSNKIVFGNCLHLNEDTKDAWGSNVELSHNSLDLSLCDYIIQPSCFIARGAWEEVGPLDIDLTYGLDWDWFIRAKRSGIDFQPVGKFLAIYRLHAQHKSGTGGEVRMKELAHIYEKYHPESVSRAYLRLKTSDVIRSADNLMRKVKLSKLLNTKRALHLMFFRELTYEQFDNISQM